MLQCDKQVVPLRVVHHEVGLTFGTVTVDQLTIASHFARAIARGLQASQQDYRPLLAQAEISDREFHDPEGRIPYQAFVTFNRLAWKALQDENLGLGATPARPGAFYYTAHLAIGAPTLSRGLELCFGLNNYLRQGYLVDIQLDDDDVLISVALIAPEKDPDHFLADCVMTGIHRFSCWLIGKKIVLKEVELNFPPPRHETEYARIYNCPRVFDADRLSIRFSRHYMDMPVVQNEQALAQYIASSPTNILLNPVDDDSYSTRIRRMLESVPPAEYPTFEQVSEQLFMVPKTLRLKLKAEGNSYQKIKDLLRRDKAIYYLNHKHYSVADIAEKVGFTETAAFIRAFKNWTGNTPGNYRNQAS